MSRLAKFPIEVPEKIKATIADQILKISGPKGELSQPSLLGVKLEIVSEDTKNFVKVTRTSNSKQAKANLGTVASLVKSMIKGVSDGWTRNLELKGVGYTAKMKGKNLVLNVGFSHDVEIPIPEGLACNAKGTTIELQSADKCLVGTYAAKIRKVQPPEPYLGKGIRYAGEVVRRKAGKAGK